MTRLKIIFVLMIGAVLFAAGCNDLFVDVEPATSVSGEEALSSQEGVEAIRASMYSTVRASFSYTTQYFIAPDSFSDLLRLRPGSTRYQTLNEATDGDGTTAHLTSWSATYDVVQDANLLIGGVEEGVLDPDLEEQYRGEALAMRAFVMHHLVRALGYEPGNFDQGPEANWDHGTIIRTEPVMDIEDADERPRDTVDDVYAQILDDLNTAAGLLEGYAAQDRLDEAFVHALTARVHLYAGNYAEAAASAQAAIDSPGPYQLADTEEAVATMFGAPGSPGDHPETIFLLVVDGNTEFETGGDWMVNTGPSAYTSNQWGSQLPVQEVLDRYEANDYRLGWYNECFDHRNNSKFGDCDTVNDEGWTIDKFPSAKHIGNAVDDMPYMRLGEVYLILAEAAAKATGNPADGVPALNTLREARGASTVSAGDFADIDEFEDFILDERVRELIAEGHRFWDLKRLGRTITHPDGSTKFRAESHRILGPVPVGEFGVNEFLIQNPGYPGGN